MRCEGIPTGPCPYDKNGSDVKLEQGDVMVCKQFCDIGFPKVNREKTYSDVVENGNLCNGGSSVNGSNNCPAMDRSDNCFKQLSDLGRIDDKKLCHTFLKNMDLIFQYSMLDIQDQLQGFSMKTLQSLHKLLCEKIQLCYSQYKERHAKSRQVKFIPNIA